MVAKRFFEVIVGHRAGLCRWRINGILVEDAGENALLSGSLFCA